MLVIKNWQYWVWPTSPTSKPSKSAFAFHHKKKTPALFPLLISWDFQMPLSCRFHRAWKDFWYFIQKARVCTAVSRAIYRQGRAEGNLGERSEVPRAGPRLRPHLTLLPDRFDEATFRSDFSGSGSSSVDSWRLGATWQSAAPDLLAHAHALRVMRHPPIFTQLLFQWLWEVSGKQQSCLLLLCKLSELQRQALMACVCACTRLHAQTGALVLGSPGSLKDTLLLP